MALPKQKFREAIFQLLFSVDFFDGEKDELLEVLMMQLKTTKKELANAFDYVLKIKDKLGYIDQEIKNSCETYDFERISKVELAIIRLGIYEMIFDDAVHEKIAIAEAIRLCRKFSSPSGANFVNAILDTFYKKHECGKQATVQ